MYSIAANTLNVDARHFLGAVPEICFKKGDYYFMSLWGLFLQQKDDVLRFTYCTKLLLNLWHGTSFWINATFLPQN